MERRSVTFGKTERAGRMEGMDSGTKKQEMVDCEEQSLLKKRSLRWEPSPFTVLDFKTQCSGAPWPCSQEQTVVSLPCLRTAKPGESDSPRLSTSAPRGDLACLSRTPQPAWPEEHIRGFSHDCVQLDQKKELSFRLCVPPCSPWTQRIPLLRRWSWTNGWLVCAQKSQRLLDVDGPLPKEPARRVSGCG